MQVVNNCNNATLAGKITAAVTGGNMNGYSYLWSNGSLNGSIENLANGNYTVTVTDAKGCTVSSSATISTKILQASVATSNIITTDCGSGSITITLTGGSGTTPYLYSSDGGINYVNNSINPSYTFNNRVPGVYVGQLKDVDGCLAIMTGNPVTIGPGTDGFTTTITANPTNLICNGLTADLSITATGSGYRYLWSSGQTTSNINNVPAGTYSVSVTQTSAPSCTARNIITVTEPTAIELENSTTNKSCSTGANNGSATIQINGGTIPYNIVWSTGAINQNTITNLAAGNYSVSVTDYNGCHSVKYFTITVPNTNPNPSLVQTLPVTCGGGNDGEIKAIATGGIGPYTFLWNTGQTSNVLSNVSASTYTVTITDVFGCTGQSFITLTGGGVNTTVTPTNTICFGNTGSITFSTTSGGGGSGTYQYSIDDGMNFQISNIFSGLSVGTYIAVAQEISSLCTSLKQSLTISTTGTSCCIGGVAELTQSSFNGGAYSGINNLNSSVTIPSGATVTLDACTLFVAANVSITVSAGATLIINNNSVLSACGNMWQGIINNGGSVFIENSIIEDAIEGLRSFNGSLFDISGSTFDHNGTSIYLDYGDFTSSRITNTEFKCTDGRITKAPYANQLSLYHIRMDWVTYFKLGNTLNATNALRNSTYGIYANQSSFDMENNVFDFDKTVPFNVYGNIPRTAVRCSNSLFDNIHIGTSAYPSNTVRNWQYGIIAGGGSTVDIQNNIITDGSLGVAVGGNLNTDITVLSNVFERCSRGTFLDGVDGSQALVQNNFYNKGLSYDFANYSYEAIRCENKLPTQVPAINIEGNEIYNCSIGIHVRNIEGTKINSQNIYQTDMPNDDIAIYGRPQFGIWIENASYTEINNNTITRNDFSSDPLHISGAPQVDLITGI